MRDGEPQITWHPIGRLGNQLFQAAAAIGYAKQYNVKWGAPRSTREVPEFHQWFPGLPICESGFRNYHEHPGVHCELHGVHKDICHFDYHPIPFHNGGVKLMGFFQSWKYFANAEQEVKKAFALKYVEGYEDYVSIHVRRGDYVQYSGSFPPVPFEGYISEAMQYYMNRAPGAPSLPIQKFLIFSDDIAWCKENIHFRMFAAEHGDKIEENRKLLEAYESGLLHFSEGRSTYEDLSLMASCGHHIIANSTFSWWASYLGKNPDRIVISPSHKRGYWFGHESGVKRDCVDLLPPNWIQIEW